MIKKKGFTLIELLVVVAIIGLLATLSIIALNTARAKARDAKRVGDIKQIQTALELYYNDNGAYPATLTDAAMKPFMSQAPVAPTPFDAGTATVKCTSGSNAYVYAPGTGNTTYTLTYCLGGDTGGIPAGLNTSTPAGIR